jgi:hypothetical protein
LILSSSERLNPKILSGLSSAPLLLRTDPDDQSCLTGSVVNSSESAIFKSWRTSETSFDPSEVADRFEKSCGGLQNIVFELQITFFLEFSQRIIYKWPSQPLSGLSEIIFDIEHAPECVVLYEPEQWKSDENFLKAAEKVRRASSQWETDHPLADIRSQIDLRPHSAGDNPFLRLLASKIESDGFNGLWHSVLQYFQRCVDHRQPIEGIGDTEIPLNHCVLHQKMVMIAIQIGRLNRKSSSACTIPVYTSDQLGEINQSIRRDLGVDTDFTSEIVKLIHEKSKCPSGRFPRDVLPGDNSATIWPFIPEQLFEADQQLVQAMEYLSTRTPQEVLPSLMYLRCCMMIESLKGSELCNGLNIRETALIERLQSFREEDLDGLVIECSELRNAVLQFRDLRAFYSRYPVIAEKLYESGFLTAESREDREHLNHVFSEWLDPSYVPMNQMILTGVVFDRQCEISHRLWVSCCEDSTVLYGSVVKTGFKSFEVTEEL